MYKNYIFSDLKDFDLFISHDIVSLSYTNYTQNEPSLPHSHQYTEIMIVAEGEGLLIINNQTTTFQQGKLYFINPNVEHSETSKGKLSYYVLKIHNFTVSTLKSAILTDMVCMDIHYGTAKHILTRFGQIMDNCELDNEDKKPLIALDLAYLYYYFTHLLKNEYHINQATIQRNSSKIRAVVNYISANYELDLKIDEIAKKFFFSPRNLLYHFQKEMGMSPSKFILAQRIQNAKNLLKNTDYSITQIASMCGYSFPSFFGKTFHKIVGVSPSQYRANYQAETKIE